MTEDALIEMVAKDVIATTAKDATEMIVAIQDVLAVIDMTTSLENKEVLVIIEDQKVVMTAEDLKATAIVEIAEDQMTAEIVEDLMVAASAEAKAIAEAKNALADQSVVKLIKAVLLKGEDRVVSLSR